MPNQYMNVYMNNPTAGGTDGTAVSTDDDFTAPITVTLDATQSETKIVKLGIRTETGFETVGDTTISDSNDTADFWKLSFDSDTGWTDTLVFSDTIVATNSIFYAKASSATTESPQRDRSVKLNVQSIIKTV